MASRSPPTPQQSPWGVAASPGSALGALIHNWRPEIIVGRTVLFHILSTCVSRALAAFGGSPLSQEAPDARAGEGSGTRGQSPDLPAGLQLLPFPLQHISSRPGLVDHRDFWKRAEQERKGRKACPLGCRA